MCAMCARASARALDGVRARLDERLLVVAADATNVIRTCRARERRLEEVVLVAQAVGRASFGAADERLP